MEIKNKMKKVKILMLLTLLSLVIAGCCHSVQTFYYRMAAPPAGEGGIGFYEPSPSDATLENVAGDDVRNVIVCIGDGMGFNHVALSRHYGAGDDKKLYMELAPIQGKMTTYSANSDVTDSAASGTAIACGIKTNNGMIGMAPDKTPYYSILESLGQKGWRTGLVVTASVSHATPAVFASHVESRNNQEEIALQEFGNRVDVLLGGGRKFWKDQTLTEAAADGYQVIENRDQLMSLQPEPVIGLFADDGMTTFAPEPSLAEMAATAISILSSKNTEWFAPKPKFFLMIEGSQIDWAAHANDTDRMVRQTLLFDMAVHQAIEFAKQDGHTLVIITADHETGGLKLHEDPDSETGIDVKWTSGTHTKTKVPVFAYGPGAEKFAGTLDNTDISKRIAELTGVKDFPKAKTTVTQEQETATK